MKNIIALVFIGLMIMSCGTTQEVEVQKPVVAKELPKRQSSDQPKKRRSVDPEQLAAQLGLSDDKTDEFVSMWNSTTESMRLVRKEYREGDKEVLFAKMQEVKNQRDEGLKTILTSSQLARFHQIMAKNRQKMPDHMKRRRGN